MTSLQGIVQSGSVRVRAAGVGALATALAIGVVVYGTYGDASADSQQKSAVPFLIGVVVVLSAVVFGLLVPWAARAARTRDAHALDRWGLALGGAAVVSMVVFWTGIPVVLGTAAAASASTRRGRASTVAIVLGAVAATVTVLWTVVNSALR